MLKTFVLSLALASGLMGAGAWSYRRGLVRFNYPSATRFPVRGIDVSHHQGSIDWSRVRGAGVDFAFIKASEGGDRHDREFARNWDEAGRVGIARGAYHFFTFCSSGLAQARNFAAVAPAGAELPPVVDVELSGNCASPPPVGEIRNELRIFLDQVGHASGRRPIIYFTRQARRRILDATLDADISWPRNIFWQPRAPWQFWQFADNERIPGIVGPVDVDVFSGNSADFATLTRPPAPR